MSHKSQVISGKEENLKNKQYKQVGVEVGVID